MNVRGAGRLALGVALATALAAEGAAQSGPPVGGSATYRWTSRATEAVSVLVQQRDAGGTVTWSLAQDRASLPPVYVTYSIVKGDARTYTLQVVTHQTPTSAPLSGTQLVVDRGSGKAIRSVIQAPKAVIPTPEAELRPLREAGVAPGTRQDVAVPAGRFTTVHGTVGGAEVWVSDQIPALGLVKAVLPAGTLELVQSAPTGATDLLRAAGK
jgi:hypothetical protein